MPANNDAEGDEKVQVLMADHDAFQVGWRLTLRSSGAGPARVRLERDISNSKDWTDVEVVDSNFITLEEAGVTWHKGGVVILDQVKTSAALLAAMSANTPAVAREWLEAMDTLPTSAPPIVEPDVAGYHRVNLLEYLVELEARAGAATGGIWYGQSLEMINHSSAAAVLDAIVTGAPTDPVCESMSPADHAHVLMTQPAAAAAMARKLREAFHLLEDLKTVAMGLRAEMSRYVWVGRRDGQEHGANRDRVRAYDLCLRSLADRCAAFPSIQVPELAPMQDHRPNWRSEVGSVHDEARGLLTAWQRGGHEDIHQARSRLHRALERDPGAARRVPLTRAAACALASKFRERWLSSGDHLIEETGAVALPKWVVDTIIEASR